MEQWHIENATNGMSPEIQEMLEKAYGKSIEEIRKESDKFHREIKLEQIEKDIKSNKKAMVTSGLSLVTRVGLAALFLGGVVSTTLGLSAPLDPTIANILQGVGLGSAATGLLAPFALDMVDSPIMENSLKEDIISGIEAKKNIKELKELQKSMTENMERGM